MATLILICLVLAPSTAAQWLAAVATSLAVVIALFKDELLRFFRRPRLSIRIQTEPPDCILVPNATVSAVIAGNPPQLLWAGPIYFLRLWIENHGIGRAEQVQVFASRLYRRDVNGRPSPVVDFEPMNLRWSNPRDPNNPEVFAPGISRGFGKHCDLCSISDPANPTDHPHFQDFIGQCVGTLLLEVVPSGDRNRLRPGDYIVEVRVGAANARPVTACIRINIKGPWSPDQATMFREHLGVEIVPCPQRT
jgi:hypothetical protein